MEQRTAPAASRPPPRSRPAASARATEAGGQVAQTTKEQAKNVVGEAKQQARDLVGEARTQVRDQAGTQRDRAVQGLRSLGDELDQMSQQGGQSGIATEVARQLSTRTPGLAGHLERHEPSDLLEQLRSYARRRPVVFLAGAALAGVVAGRLTRSLAAGARDRPRAHRRLGDYRGTTGAASRPAEYAPAAGYGRAGTSHRRYADRGGGYQAGVRRRRDTPASAAGYQPGPGPPATGRRRAPGHPLRAGPGAPTAPESYDRPTSRDDPALPTPAGSSVPPGRRSTPPARADHAARGWTTYRPLLIRHRRTWRAGRSASCSAR